MYINDIRKQWHNYEDSVVSICFRATFIALKRGAYDKYNFFGRVVKRVKCINISSPYSYIHDQITPLVGTETSHHCCSGPTVVPRRKKIT